MKIRHRHGSSPGDRPSASAERTKGKADRRHRADQITPRELILDVLGALDWGLARVADVSVHIYGVPRGATWREGAVRVHAISDEGEPCPWPAMTLAQAVAEAAELIEYAETRLNIGPARVAAAREVLRVAAERCGRGGS